MREQQANSIFLSSRLTSLVMSVESTSPALDVISRDEKWDHVVENFIRKASIGFAIGVLPSVMFARSLAARCGVVALFTGMGSGMAYTEARYLFDHNITFDKRYLVQLRLDTGASS